MQIKLVDVLHLYLGCEGKNHNGETIDLTSRTLNLIWCNVIGFKPILRPLSDMTEEEALIYFSLPLKSIILKKNVYAESISFNYKWVNPKYASNNQDSFSYSEVGIGNGFQSFTQKQFLFLLKRGFDLFGLIESGQAIDKTTLKP